MLPSVVVMVLVVVVVVVESDVNTDSHLYSECIVKKSGEITTFEDSVKFWFVKTSEDDLKIKFDEEGNSFTLQYRSLAQHAWLQAELKLSGDPELLIQGKIQKSTRSSHSIGTRKTFTIEDVDILLQCPQGWPNRGLSSSEGSDVRIPSSGKEESLVLTPTVDTKVNFSMSGNNRTLCWNTSSSGLAVVGGEMENDCGDLRSNSAVTLKFLFEGNNVEVQDDKQRQLDNITFQGVRNLKFLRDGLKGPVYIAQCIDSCTTGTSQDNGEASSINTIETSRNQSANDPKSCSNPMKQCPSCVIYIVLVVIVAVVVLLLSCYVLHLRRQILITS